MCHAGYPQNPCSAAQCLTNVTQCTEVDADESERRYRCLKSETCQENVCISPQNQLFRKVRKKPLNLKVQDTFWG